MSKRKPWLIFIAIMTLGSGILNILSVIGPSLPERVILISEVFPLEFRHLSRFLTLLIGFAQVFISFNMFKRKKRAYHLAIVLSLLSVVFHITKGLDYEEASVSLLLFFILFFARSHYTVKSSVPNFRLSLLQLVLTLILALGYGSIGFWLIEKRHFDVNFIWHEALKETFLFLTLQGDPSLTARTHHAAWFLDSLYLITVCSIAFTLFLLFRPVLYRFSIVPHHLELAKNIVHAHGRSSLDFFKYWPDKSLYFSPTNHSVIAYRVGNGAAMVLADPVGPEDEIEKITQDFIAFCSENDWDVAFHQTLPDFLPMYERLGFHKLKIGDDAIVDLEAFHIEDKSRKAFRQIIRKMEGLGITCESYAPPLSDAVLKELRAVSDDWLLVPDKRERRFTLGLFDADYLRLTPVLVAKDQAGTLLAFMNIIPSFHQGESTIDLMRRKASSPHGVIDFLFIKIILQLKEQGYQRFNMGMAPMAGFQENEEASMEERAIHYFFQRLDFLFSYRGLQYYKAKFASTWEPRFLVYKNALDLPKIALALREVSECEK
jgi:phosphatidylglycerol lysyltransferase